LPETKKKKSKINKKEVHDHKPSSLKNRGCIYFKNLNKKKIQKKKKVLGTLKEFEENRSGIKFVLFIFLEK